MGIWESPMIVQLTQEQLPLVLELNQRHMPHVSSVDLPWLQEMHANSQVIINGMVDNERLAAFYIAMPPGLEYDSMNYQWFMNELDSFMYLDRIVVDDDFQGQGRGKQLYHHLREVATGTYPRITCEVNIRPMNQSSLDFHEHLGFEAEGEQDTEGGTKTVRLLAWEF